MDRITWPSSIGSVPPGAVIVDDDRAPWLVTSRGIRPFTFRGWGACEPARVGVVVEVLTPPTSVAALVNGFIPRLHPTASA